MFYTGSNLLLHLPNMPRLRGSVRKILRWKRRYSPMESIKHTQPCCPHSESDVRDIVYDRERGPALRYTHDQRFMSKAAGPSFNRLRQEEREADDALDLAFSGAG